MTKTHEVENSLTAEDDTENNCFVCGNTRMEFGKKSVNFNKHITQHHDPWTYIYFIYYLKDKGESELSGIEYEAWQGFLQKNTDWVPIGKTRYLEAEDSSQLKLLETRIEKLTETLTGMRDDTHKTLRRYRKIQEGLVELEQEQTGVRR